MKKFLLLFLSVFSRCRGGDDSWVDIEGSVYCMDHTGKRIPISGLNMSVHEEDWNKNLVAEVTTKSDGNFSIKAHDNEGKAEFYLSFRHQCNDRLDDLHKCKGVVREENSIEDRFTVGDNKIACRCTIYKTCWILSEFYIPDEFQYHDSNQPKTFHFDFDITKANVFCIKKNCKAPEMNDSDQNWMDGIKNAHRKAFDVSSSDGIGNLLNKAVNLLLVVTKGDVDPEKLQIASNALEAELGTRECEEESDTPLRDLLYGLCESMGTSMDWMGNREEKNEREREKMTMSPQRTFGVWSDDEMEGGTDNNIGEDVEESNDRESPTGASKKSRENEKEKSSSSLDCDVCGKTFQKMARLKIHKIIHLEDEEKRRPYECTTCGKRFTQHSALYTHKRTHMTAEEKKSKSQSVVCDVCGKKFEGMNSRRNRTIHKRIHMEDEEEKRPFPCERCGKRFTQSSGLWSHKKTHLDEDDPRKKKDETKKFSCDTCGKSYYRRNSLNIHKRRHLEDEEAQRPHSCSLCGKRFSQSTSLNAHKLIHLPDGDPRKKTVECNVCRERFTRADIEEHKKTHLNYYDVARPFKCSHCGKGFARLQHLERHQIEGHLPSDDPRRKTRCEECGKMISKRHLTQHKETHLDENDPEQASRKRPFKCEQCGHSFRRQQHLKYHMRIHNDDYPIRCPVCSKGFNAAHQLAKHTQKSCKSKSCALCPRRFREESELEEHEKRHRDSSTSSSKRGSGKTTGGESDEEEEESEEYYEDEEESSCDETDEEDDDDSIKNEIDHSNISIDQNESNVHKNDESCTVETSKKEKERAKEVVDVKKEVNESTQK